jgi:S1-C subfamily serine protease
MKHTMKSLPAFTIALALPALALADEFADKARPIFKKYQNAVMTVQMVLKNKVTMQGSPGQSSESRQEITGTVIDASGLTVVSLSTLDPGQMVQNLMAGDRFRMETELTDLKLLLPDGLEIPAAVVLRDKDLDLGFIRPKAKLESAMTFIDLSDAGEAEVADPLLALNRLGNAAGRAFSASAERVSAIVRRPRLFYVPDSNMTTSSLGCPAFTMDGKVLGLMVMRATRGGASAGSFSSQNPNYTGIILPAADVLKIAKQAPEAGKESEAPKEEVAPKPTEEAREKEAPKADQ